MIIYNIKSDFVIFVCMLKKCVYIHVFFCVFVGLQPYTNYSFIIVACTAAGCGASQPSMGRTLEDAPAG